MFALTTQNELLVVEQFRAGCLEVTLETPGGIVDDHEHSHAAAIRELCEETGYQAHQLNYLGALCPNPAINTNRVHYYLARTLQKRSQNLDPNEVIQVKRIALDDFAKLIDNSIITHASSSQDFVFSLAS